jgi:RES domain-containing protein
LGVPTDQRGWRSRQRRSVQPPGIEALYLSLEPETALAEYQQGATITPPGTLIAYRVDVGSVLDFSQGYDPAIWPEDWVAADCDWKHIARIERHDPPSWRLGDALISSGTKGLLFPSYRRLGGTNLVLFNGNLEPADHVVAYDPEGKLPRNQSSWPNMC